MAHITHIYGRKSQVSEINIPNAPAHLKKLLQELPKQTGGFEVSQHFHQPEANEWYSGWSGGDCGPYNTAEEALYGGIRWLNRIYEEAAKERDDYLAELQALRKQLDGDHLPPEWERAFNP